MKMIYAFFLGIISTIAFSAAAQRMDEGGLTPAVQIFDMRTKIKLLDCMVTLTILDGHRIMCDQGRR